VTCLLATEAPRLCCAFDERPRLVLPEVGNNDIRKVPIYHDKLSGMSSFFSDLPLEYLHHDDRINPRSIGANIRGLIEEFQQKRPQLHVGLAWWELQGGQTLARG
jgi:hypothetical protein